MRFALTLVPHAQRLQEMLGTANRIALPSEQRVVVELGEIEDDARHAKAIIDTPPTEPSTLIAARTALTGIGQQVQELQNKLDQAGATVQQLQQRRPWWQRVIALFTGATALGAAGLCAIAAKLQREQQFDADDFGELRLSRSTLIVGIS